MYYNERKEDFRSEIIIQKNIKRMIDFKKAYYLLKKLFSLMGYFNNTINNIMMKL